MDNEEKILELLAHMSADMVTMKEDMVTMKEDMVTMKADMAKMQEQIDRVDERSRRTAVLLETEVTQKLNLLYEGHGLIMESLDKLAPSDRVEKVESDVIVLKTAVKTLAQDVTDLKKAQ